MDNNLKKSFIQTFLTPVVNSEFDDEFNPNRYTALEVDGLIRAGLNDQTFQLKVYIALAHKLNLSLILPKTNLCPNHNNGRLIEFVWGEYYDLESASVNDEPQTLLKPENNIDINKILKIQHLRRNTNSNKSLHRLWDELKADVKISPRQDYIVYGKKFVADNKIDACLHIRRGDRLIHGDPKHSGLIYDIASQPFNIIRCLRDLTFRKNVYVMTDMASTDPIIKKLRSSKHFNFSFLYDDQYLQEIKADNNYQAFMLENCIFRAASQSIDTNTLKNFYLCQKSILESKKKLALQMGRKAVS